MKDLMNNNNKTIINNNNNQVKNMDLKKFIKSIIESLTGKYSLCNQKLDNLLIT